jgi:hypothetical protein
MYYIRSEMKLGISCCYHKLNICSMDNTILIQVTDQKVLKLLHELKKLHLIKVIQENKANVSSKLSEKYRGVFTKEDAKSFSDHTQQLRKECDNTL